MLKSHNCSIIFFIRKVKPKTYGSFFPFPCFSPIFFTNIFNRKIWKMYGEHLHILYISEIPLFPFQSYYTGLLIYHIDRLHIYPFNNSPINPSYFSMHYRSQKYSPKSINMHEYNDFEHLLLSHTLGDEISQNEMHNS